MTEQCLRLELGARSYPIHIGGGLIGRPELVSPHVAGRQVMVVTNETVAPLYLDQALAAFAQFDTRSLVLPDGEAHKNLDVLNRVFDALLEARFGRDCTLVALGGGVVGDITGFAAACYQRGVAFIQMPTTLLAQVDSSVGGKTGVNHRLGKNMIGAFHQPTCVIADTDTLSSLERRELSAGVAEVIKYGLIGDTAFFDWLEKHVEAVLSLESNPLAHAVRRSCECKAEVVSADEREGGRRALLNFGHTFGHAIEAGLGFGRWLHGEAVAAGMCQAADLSVRMGWLTRGAAQRIETLIARAGLPTKGPSELDAPRMLELMALDKKVKDVRLRLVLLKAIGEAVMTDNFDRDALRATLADCREAA